MSAPAALHHMHMPEGVPRILEQVSARLRGYPCETACHPKAWPAVRSTISRFSPGTAGELSAVLSVNPFQHLWH